MNKWDMMREGMACLVLEVDYSCGKYTTRAGERPGQERDMEKPQEWGKGKQP